MSQVIQQYLKKIFGEAEVENVNVSTDVKPVKKQAQVNTNILAMNVLPNDLLNTYLRGK